MTSRGWASNGFAFTGGLAPQMHDQTYDHRPSTMQGNLTRGLDNAGYNKMLTEQEARTRWDMLQSYFGEPVKRGEGLGAFTFAKDLETLPEAFFTGTLGNLPTLSQIIITQLTESDNVWTKVLLPLVAREGSTEWFQSFIVFNDHLLDVEPHLAVPRMVNHTQTTRGYQMVRKAKAFHLEYDFYETPEGRLRYVMSLVQIANATQETMNMDVARAILGATYAGINRDDTIIGLEAYRAMVLAERDDTFVLQKSASGLAYLYTAAQQQLQQRGNYNVNTVILPMGASKYVATRPEFNVPELSGQPRPKVPPRTDSDSLRQIAPALGGSSVIISRAFHVGEGRKNLDLFFREIVIGSFNFMDVNKFTGVNRKPFRTSQRDIQVHSLDFNDFADVRFHDAMANCPLWDAEKRLTAHGVAFFTGRTKRMALENDHKKSNMKFGEFLADVGFTRIVDNQIRAIQADDHQRQAFEGQLLRLVSAEDATRCRIDPATGAPVPPTASVPGGSAKRGSLFDKIVPFGRKPASRKSAGGSNPTRKSEDADAEELPNADDAADKSSSDDGKSALLVSGGPLGKAKGSGGGVTGTYTFTAAVAGKAMAVQITDLDNNRLLAPVVGSSNSIGIEDVIIALVGRPPKGREVMSFITFNSSLNTFVSNAKRGSICNEASAALMNYLKPFTDAEALKTIVKSPEAGAATQSDDAFRDFVAGIATATQQQVAAVAARQDFILAPHENEIRQLVDLYLAMLAANQAERKIETHVAVTFTGGQLDTRFPVRVEEDYARRNEEPSFENSEVIKLIRAKAPAFYASHRQTLYDLRLNLGDLAMTEVKKICQFAALMEYAHKQRDAQMLAFLEAPGDADVSFGNIASLTAAQCFTQKQVAGPYARIKGSAEFREFVAELDGGETRARDQTTTTAETAQRHDCVKLVSHVPLMQFGRLLFLFAEYDVIVPLSFILARPFQVFTAGTAVFLDRRELGKTYYGHARFSMEGDAKQRIFYGHFSAYSSAVVEQPERVIVKPDVFCANHGYQSGNGRGTRFFSASQNQKRISRGETGGCSYIVIPVRPGWTPTNMEYIDLCGFDNETVTNVPRNKQPEHYPGCDIWANYYKFRHSGRLPGRLDEHETAEAVQNTIVFVDFQRSYNPVTGDIDDVVQNKGHLGHVYATSGNVWKGVDTHLQPYVDNGVRVAPTIAVF